MLNPEVIAVLMIKFSILNLITVCVQVYRISCLAYLGAVGVLGGAEVVLQEDNHLVNYELVQHVPNMVKCMSFFFVTKVRCSFCLLCRN